EDIIADEHLAPQGVTAPSLENFLCQVNPHVCTRSKNRNLWSNTEATENYIDRGLTCEGGSLPKESKSLPKFVLCIPSIRLEPYDSVTTILFEGRGKKSLKEIVDKLGWCSSWNDECREVIRLLNSAYETKFVPDPGLLPKRFEGDLRLPVRGYRLVIEYADRG